MADQVRKPGVDISQEITAIPVTPVAPGLVPCVAGPAFEVMEAEVDGVLNSEAAIANVTYKQLPVSVAASEFPSEHNVPTAELDYLVNEIDITLGSGTIVRQLTASPGDAFLTSVHTATRPALYCTVASLADAEHNLIFQSSVNTAQTTVTIPAEATQTTLIAAVEQNTGLQAKVYGATQVIITLPDSASNYGPKAYLHVRRSGTVNSVTDTEDHDVGVWGGGLAVDTVDSSYLGYTPSYFKRADFSDTAADAAAAFGVIDPGDPFKPIWLKAGFQLASNDGNTGTDPVYFGSVESDVDFSSLDLVASTPRATGDHLWADGINVGIVSAIESSRIRLAGGIDAANSTYDSEGNPVNQRYTPLTMDASFSPKFAYFRAQSLKGQDATATSATLTTDLTAEAHYTPASAPVIELASYVFDGDNDAVNTVSLGGTSLQFQTEVDGVLSQVYSYSFPVGAASNFATVAALQAHLDTVVSEGFLGDDILVAENATAYAPLAVFTTGNTVFGVRYTGGDVATDKTVTLVGGGAYASALDGDDLTLTSNTTVALFKDAVAADNVAAADFTIDILKGDGSDTVAAGAQRSIAGGKSVQVKFNQLGSSNKLHMLAPDVSTASGLFHEVTSSVLGTAWAAAEGVTGVDATVSDLSGETFEFKLDGQTDYTLVTLTNDKVSHFVSEVNLAAGVSFVSFDANTNKVVYTSPMRGRTSTFDLKAFAVFNAQQAVVCNGSGRPDPDLRVDNIGTAHLGGQMIRDQRPGTPLVASDVSYSLYVSYRALRLDLSDAAADPGLLKISNFTDLSSLLNPIDTRNPLGLAVYYAMLNAGSGVEISAIGVSDVSDTEPEGTALAYATVTDFLRAHEVFAIAPLTSAEPVIQLFDTHVTDMSDAENRGERVLISAPKRMTRGQTKVALSGTTAGSSNTNIVNLGAPPGDGLAALGIDPESDVVFPMADGRELFLEITVGAESRNYVVGDVSQSVITVQPNVSSTYNTDGFYSQVVLSENLEDVAFSLQVRGAKLTLPSSDRLDKSALATATRDVAKQYNNRRQLRLFPDTVQTIIEGTEQAVESYFYAAAIAGASAGLEAQEPFSRRSMDGFTSVIGPDLESKHLDIISAGNAVIEVESPGLAPSIRIQSTTAPDNLNTREYSIVKAVDQFAKTLRVGLKNRVGIFNITQTYLDDTATIIDSICNNAVSDGLLASAVVDRIVQDSASPDTLKIDVSVGVLYPANYIKLTIVV